MDDLRQETHAAIEAALKRHASSVKRIGSGRWGRWDLRLGNGSPRQATACAQPGWLTVAAGPAGPNADPWTMLHANAGAGAGVKLVFETDGGNFASPPEPAVRGELAIDLDEPCDLEPRIGELLAGVTEVLAPRRRRRTARRGADTPDLSQADRLCTEAGWPFTDRAEGRIAVALEVPRRPFTAVIEHRENHGLVASVTLAWGEGPPESSHGAALAILLLRATGSVRLARAAAVAEAEGRFAARLEAVLPAGAAGRDLHHALSALSVACQLCGPEAELLHENAEIAETYLLGCSQGRPLN